MAEDAEIVGGGGGDCEEGMVKKSLYKNLNGADYLTLDAKKAFNNLRYMFIKALIL